MKFEDGLKIAGSALSAQRLRMNTISNNLANAQTTHTQDGGPYKRQEVVFQPRFENHLLERIRAARTHEGHLPFDNTTSHGGVIASQIQEDQTPGKEVYEPGHPDANAEGYVMYPNVNVVQEMTNMMSATRSYEASVTAFQSMKSMALKALEIGRA
jgi:flagellar basal-body rod protein FlgC